MRRFRNFFQYLGLSNIDTSLKPLHLETSLKRESKVGLFCKSVMFCGLAVILFYLSIWVESWDTLPYPFIHFIVRPTIKWALGMTAFVMAFYSLGNIYLIFRKIYIERRDRKWDEER